MYEGQRVVCISEDFPVFKTTSEDKSSIGTLPALHPKIGERLFIDEVLGDFLRFDKYDSDDPESINFGFNWWHSSRFCIESLSEEEIAYVASNSQKQTV